MVTVMTGMYYHTQLFTVEMNSCELFLPKFMIHLISASGNLGMTGKDHHAHLLIETGWSGFSKFLPGLSLNHNLPDLSFRSS
jgi:hypothetical protein